MFNLHTSIQPFGPTESPAIALVGDYPDQADLRKGIPFQGGAGRELHLILQEVGINPELCYQTTVFKSKLPGRDIKSIQLKKSEAQAIAPSSVPIKFVGGKFLHPDFANAPSELWEELRSVRPNIIIALGAVANWALTGNPTLAACRGTVCSSHNVPSKVLPTYSPAMILAQYDQRPILQMDLIKALRESAFPEIRKPDFTIWIEPTLDDLETFWTEHLASAPKFSVDIETAHGEITCVGFGTATASLTVPLVDRRAPEFSYWPDPASELSALEFISRVLSSPTPKVLQNGLYDVQWLWRKLGMPVRQFTEDTMIRHHSMYSELEKGLGFLGSVYTDMPSWKAMRKRSDEMEKSDD